MCHQSNRDIIIRAYDTTTAIRGWSIIMRDRTVTVLNWDVMIRC